MSDPQTRVSPPNEPAVPADSDPDFRFLCELAAVLDPNTSSIEDSTAARNAALRKVRERIREQGSSSLDDPLSIPPQTLPGGVGQSIDLPAHELPWREDEKGDPNYGRVCVCGAAIRSGGRLVHECRMPVYEKLRTAIRRLTAHAEALREENTRLQGVRGLGTTSEVSTMRSTLAVFESTLRRRIKEIESDDRYPKSGEKKADVVVNSPLALIQLEGTSAVNALQWVLGERVHCAGSYPTQK